ncbi:PucR family transcriptional regulator [Nonomuraea endophytica]|uniref:Putative coiled-coil protein SlyX n=1 Tax=Nonomuraea endophytica TaxID=714136 RepID=A0A7W8EIF6_9ACTN|nr:helix-turn-helix domain-containing protein [Nonomuraea endophytica]MBB5080471.1 putative coiled-coil protein SlyX [Nonomuraea endophytica]
MRLRELVRARHLHLKVLTGHDLLDRQVRGVSTTDLAEPGRFVKPGELVLTELTWHTGAESSRSFVKALGDVAALVSGTALKGVPLDLVDACAEAGLPLLTLPVEVPFSHVTEHVLRALIAELGSPPRQRYGSRRRLASTLVDGGSLTKVVTAVAGELDVPCWVMSPTGRVIVGSQPLAEEERARLAHTFLTARHLPGMVGGLSVFPISKGAPHRIANWFLAYAGEQAQGENEDLIVELAALVALERSRLEAAQRIERRVFDQLLELLESGDAALPGVVSRLHTLHVETEHGLLVVALSAPGDAGVAVLDELLRPLAPGIVTAAPGTASGTSGAASSAHGGHGVAGAASGTRGAGGAVSGVAASDGEAIALVPLAGNSARELIRHVMAGARRLEAGLGGEGRIALGVSSVTTGPAALSGLIEEARHARSLAALSGERISVITGDDVSSHRTLLAAIPADLRRSFRTRLLGTLEAYDAAHQTDLLETLQAFLEESGNWTTTSERLHVHVNTLRYRLKRIEELTGRSLNSWDQRVDFMLAVRMR